MFWFFHQPYTVPMTPMTAKRVAETCSSVNGSGLVNSSIPRWQARKERYENGDDGFHAFAGESGRLSCWSC